MTSDLPPESKKHVPMFKKFLKLYYWDDILLLLLYYPDRISLRVDMQKLLRGIGHESVEKIIESPAIYMQAMDQALREMDLPITKTIEKARVELCNSIAMIRLADLSERYAFQFVSVQGVIKQLSEPKPTYTTAVFMCWRCGTLISVEQPSSGQLVVPMLCDNDTCGKKGPFDLDEAMSTKVMSRLAILQEDINGLENYDRPKTLKVRIHGHELCNSIHMGQRVILSGVLNIEHDVAHGCKHVAGSWILDLNSVDYLESTYQDIEISAEDEQKILELFRDPNIEQKCVSSIAPSIHGMAAVKEAICLQIFGGVSKENPDGTRLRGDIHIMTCGDPGVAKSQLLEYVVKVTPHSVYANGVSSSGVGITASVVADELNPKKSTFAPGALVLANGGIACLDELDKMNKEDRNSLHEPMEQQTITLSKAGLNEILPTRCSILAAANPKYGRFDRYESIADQVNLPASLLSRFDLIFVVQDIPDPKTDKGITDQICSNHALGTLNILKEHGHPVDPDTLQEITERVEPPIPIDLFRKSVAYARKNIFPVFGPDVQEYMQDSFEKLRMSGKDNLKSAIPVTFRSFEGMIRLAEASARSRLSSEIILHDAERVVRIMENCLRSVGVDPETGILDADVIQLGRSHSQRELIHHIKENIKSQGKQHPRGEAQLEEVFLSLNGKVPRDRFDKYIKELKEKGFIYCPNAEFVKLVKEG